MKQITKIAIVLIVAIAMIGSAGAQEIKAADGTDLPDTVYIGNTFKVLVMENGAPVGAGITVVFTFEGISGITPTTVATDVDGIARYKPYVNGVLTIRVLDDVMTVRTDYVTVTDEPWVPQPTPTKKSHSSGGSGGGGGFVLPDPTPVNDTANTTVNDSIIPQQTISPMVEPVVENTVVVEKTKSKSRPIEPESPGFAGVFAISGILIIVYFRRIRNGK